MKKHDLKLKVSEFVDVWEGLQRGVFVDSKLKVQIGDSIVLREYVNSITTFTGREIVCIVIHAIRDDEYTKYGIDFVSIFCAIKRIVND